MGALVVQTLHQPTEQQLREFATHVLLFEPSEPLDLERIYSYGEMERISSHGEPIEPGMIDAYEPWPPWLAFTVGIGFGVMLGIVVGWFG